MQPTSADGSFTSFPLSRRVRFAPRAERQAPAAGRRRVFRAPTSPRCAKRAVGAPYGHSSDTNARLLPPKLGSARFNGALGGIRTPDPQIRSLVLYPAELRALRHFLP